MVESLRHFEERNRFLRGLVSWVGYPQTTIPFRPGKREVGQSKFGFLRLWKLAIDGIFAFSYAPLRLVSVFGVITAAFAFVLGAFYLVTAMVKGQDPPGWPSIFVAVAFFSGVQMLLTGIVGEYLARVYDEVKRRPLYVIRESIGMESDHDPCADAPAEVSKRPQHALPRRPGDE